jgi:hypothetical protein
MTFTDFISALAGAIISLLATYIPGLKTRFDKLSTEGKQGVMAITLVISSVFLAYWRCSLGGKDYIDPSFPDLCLSGNINWRTVGQSLFFALSANQSTHRISPKVDNVVNVLKGLFSGFSRKDIKKIED